MKADLRDAPLMLQDLAVSTLLALIVFQKMTICPRIIDATTSHVGD